MKKQNAFIQEKGNLNNSNNIKTSHCQQAYLTVPSDAKTKQNKGISQNDQNNEKSIILNSLQQGDQFSEQSDEENLSLKSNYFLNMFKEFKLKKRILSFLSEIPSRRFNRLHKKHFAIIEDLSSHFKVNHQQLSLKKQSFFRSQTTLQHSSTIYPFEIASSNNPLLIATNSCVQLISTFVHKLKSKIIKFLYKVPLIDFESNSKLVWDCLYIGCSLIFYFSIPLHVSLNLQVKQIVEMTILSVSLWILIIHIFITLNTCYFEKGKLVSDRTKIFQNYFQNELIPDISSYLPLSILIYSNSDDSEGRVGYSSGGVSWMSSRKIEHDSWPVQYLQGFYFMTVTMISVGYGDIVPQTSLEIVLCIVIMLISCVVFAYSLNMIGDILGSIQEQDNIVKQQVRIIGNYMVKNNINPQLRQQIRIYLEYYQRQFSEQNEKEEKIIIGQLSENLKNSLILETNKFILRDSPIFSKFFSQGVLEQMVGIIKEYRCTPEQVIYERSNNNKEEHRIYFIKSGIVQIYADRSHHKPTKKFINKITPVRILKQGDSFGEIQFFTGNNDSYSARSLEFSQVLYINRNEFLDIIKQSPLDYEKFCFIKDKISLIQNASCINLKCSICQNANHLVKNCNITHLVLDKSLVAKRQQFLIPIQERQPFLRRSLKILWFDQIEEVRECAWKLQDANESFIENASWMSWDTEGQDSSEQENSRINLNHQDNMNYQMNYLPSLQEKNSSDSSKVKKQSLKLMNLDLNYSKDVNAEGSKYKKIFTPSNFHKQNYQHRNLLTQDSQFFGEGFRHLESQGTMKGIDKENLESQNEGGEELVQKITSPKNNELNASQFVYSNQRKLMKMIEKLERTNSQSSQQQSKIYDAASYYFLNNHSQHIRNMNKGLSILKHQDSLLYGGNAQMINSKKQMDPVFSKQQASDTINNQLNLAEIIGNQLLINGNNNYIKEENTNDIKKIFEFYFKHNNYPNVLKNYNKPIIKLIKQLNKNRTKKRKGLSFSRQVSLKVLEASQHQICNGSSSSPPKRSLIKQKDKDLFSHSCHKKTMERQSTFRKQQNEIQNENSMMDHKKEIQNSDPKVDKSLLKTQQDFKKNYSIPKVYLSSPNQFDEDSTYLFNGMQNGLDSDASLITVSKKFPEKVKQQKEVFNLLKDKEKKQNKSTNLLKKNDFSNAICVNPKNESNGDQLSDQIWKFRERKRFSKQSHQISNQQYPNNSFQEEWEGAIGQNQPEKCLNAPQNSIDREKLSLTKQNSEIFAEDNSSQFCEERSINTKEKRNSKESAKKRKSNDSNSKRISNDSMGSKKQRFSNLMKIHEQKTLEHQGTLPNNNNNYHNNEIMNIYANEDVLEEEKSMNTKQDEPKLSSGNIKYLIKQIQSHTYIQSQQQLSANNFETCSHNYAKHGQENKEKQQDLNYNSELNDLTQDKYNSQLNHFKSRKTRNSENQMMQSEYEGNISSLKLKQRKSEQVSLKSMPSFNQFSNPFLFQQTTHTAGNQMGKISNQRRFSRAYNMSLIPKRISSKYDLPQVTESFTPSYQKKCSLSSYTNSISSRSKQSQLGDFSIFEPQIIIERDQLSKEKPICFNFDAD